MKKIALFSMVALFSAAMMASCASNPCVTCSGVKVCKDSYTSTGGVSWDDYVTAAKAVGCTVD